MLLLSVCKPLTLERAEEEWGEKLAVTEPVHNSNLI